MILCPLPYNTLVQLKNTDKCHRASSVGTVARAECWSPSSTGGVRGLQGQWLQLNASVSGTMAIWVLEILIEWTGVGLRILSTGLDQMPYQRWAESWVPVFSFFPSELQGLDYNQTLLLDGSDYREKQSTWLGERQSNGDACLQPY